MQMRYVPILITLYLVCWHLALLGFGIQDTKAYTQKNLEKIKAISKENALIYLPCHRSHIDYCALTYLLYENGLMVPQVAAGNNLNLPFLGSILRGGQAQFSCGKILHEQSPI